MIKLAFIINFNQGKWLGGLNIILNLIESIVSNQSLKKKVKLYLIAHDIKKFRKYKFLKKITIIKDKNILNQSFLEKLIDRLMLLFFNKTFFLEKFLKKNKIDIISHSNIVTGKASSCKSIIWIPDFQYFHFPNFFSLKYKIMKEINLRFISKYSSKILLSSFDAQKDLEKIYKPAVKKSFVNQFTFQTPHNNKGDNFLKIKRKYNLPKKFFYLPNQYWVHKNHFVVLKALCNLKLKNNGIKILSTGFNYDYRRPEYFNNILKFIKENGLEKNFYYLGVLPYQHSLSLIKNSVAVINPSLFEGWSSTVEQSKSIGKKIILSNINVHKEQNPKNCYYFNPKNHLELSKIMKRVWNERKLEKKANFKKYQNIAKIKFKNYSKDYCKIVFDLYEKNKDI